MEIEVNTVAQCKCGRVMHVLKGKSNKRETRWRCEWCKHQETVPTYQRLLEMNEDSLGEIERLKRVRHEWKRQHALMCRAWNVAVKDLVASWDDEASLQEELKKLVGVVEYIQVLIPQLQKNVDDLPAGHNDKHQYALDWAKGALEHNGVPLESETSKKRVTELMELGQEVNNGRPEETR